MNALISTNPLTKKKMAEVPSATSEDIRQAVETARNAQGAWRSLGVGERSRYIRQIQRVILKERDSLADLLSQETGKPPFEALVNEVGVTLDLIGYYAKNAEKFLRRKKISLHALHLKLTKKAFIEYEPHGVVGIITPWNYPFSLAIDPSVCALLAGNTVVLKPSEATPLVGLRIKKIFEKVGLPPGVFQVVMGSGEAGAALLASPIDKIHFTGSVATGTKVAEQAAKRLLPCVLELGGSDPMIVLKDADLERAANAALWGRFANAGQTCNAVKRVLVHQSVVDDFTQLLREKAQIIKKELNGYERQFGPLINEKQLELIQSQLNDSIKEGAHLVTGGKSLGTGYFLEPTILRTNSGQLRAMKEETFGPVLPVMSFENESEALLLANQSPYGLGASIFTRDILKAKALAREIQAGCVLINDVLANYAVAELPFGGPKATGSGLSHGGAEGLRAFARRKAILIDRWGLKSELYWYPYSEKKYRVASWLLNLVYGRLRFLLG